MDFYTPRTVETALCPYEPSRLSPRLGIRRRGACSVFGPLAGGALAGWVWGLSRARVGRGGWDEECQCRLGLMLGLVWGHLKFRKKTVSSLCFENLFNPSLSECVRVCVFSNVWVSVWMMEYCSWFYGI